MATSFDVILFGPTGVTGREVARYLHRRAAEVGLTWAVAGRDRQRIEEALRNVSAAPDAILVADVGNNASIEAMVGQARVVANLVGPYARFGEPVHRACARAGVHQLDLCGEIDWLREMIDRYDDIAADSGACIVPSAGFESLPFDLGALLAARTARARHGDAVVDVDAAVAINTTAPVSRLADAVSGGTFGSMVGMLRRGDSGPADPHALDPGGAATKSRYDLSPRRHGGTGAWLSPLFPTPFLNPPVAHRSAALLRDDGDPLFAPSYRYREGTVTASMMPGPDLPGVAPAMSAMLALGQSAVGAANRLPGWIREGLAEMAVRIGPSSGEGPSADTLDAWSYRIDIRAVTVGGGTADVAVEAVGHPGYKSTAMLVGEAALALAAMSTSPRAGYSTPATVFGVDDLDRFVNAGATFTVIDRPPA